jgi:hypothetical protein
MWYSEILDAWSCGGWGVFIASTTKVAVGEAAGDGRTGQSSAPLDMHCRLSGASPRHPTIRVWSPVDRWGLCPLVAPDSPVLHRTVRCPLTSRFWLLSLHCSRVRFFCSRLLPTGSPDRWIIAECAWVFPRVAGWTQYGPGAPDTVRWHTRQSGALNHNTLGSFCSFELDP